VTDVIHLISLVTAALCLVALVSLWRRSRPLPLARALRGSRVISGPWRHPVNRRRP
jgi:hypothetical protein